MQLNIYIPNLITTFLSGFMQSLLGDITGTLWHTTKSYVWDPKFITAIHERAESGLGGRDVIFSPLSLTATVANHMHV